MSIGDDLRAIADELARRGAAPPVPEEVVASVAATRAALDAAPSTPRWDDVDPSDRDASRAHHDRYGALRGSESVIAPPLVFGDPVTRDGRAVVNAIARCGSRYEGPPGVVHGGIVAACFDEVLAVAIRDTGIPGLTRELNVRYRRPVHLDTPLVFTAWIEQDDGRRALGRAACHADSELCADATAEFVRPR